MKQFSYLLAGAVLFAASTAWAQKPDIKIQRDGDVKVNRDALRDGGPIRVQDNRDFDRRDVVRDRDDRRDARDDNKWRYKYQNNHWWYWTPGNSWVIYHNNGWVPYSVDTYYNYYPRRTYTYRDDYRYRDGNRYRTGYRGDYDYRDNRGRRGSYDPPAAQFRAGGADVRVYPDGDIRVRP